MSRPSDHRITIRFKPEEYALIRGKAGATPLAQFVRESALGAAGRKRAATARRPVADAQAMAQVLAMLGASGLVSDFQSRRFLSQNNG